MAVLDAQLVDTLGLAAFWDEAHGIIRGEIASAVSGLDGGGGGNLGYEDIVGIVDDEIGIQLSDYRTVSQIREMIASSVAGFGEGLEYDDVVGIIEETIPAYTSSFIQFTDLAEYVTESQVTEIVASGVGDLPTATEIGDMISGSLTGYYTKTETDGAITDALIPYRTSTQIDQMISNSLYYYVSSQALSSALSSALSNVGGGNPLIFKGSASWSANMSSTVMAIPAGAFAWRQDLPSVMSLNSVKAIGDAAFYSASGLTSLGFTNAINTIGDFAFYSCKTLVSATLNAVNKIGEYAFAYCTSLNSTIGTNAGGPMWIGDRAFWGCTGLKSINLSYVHHVGDYAFYGCTGISGTVYMNLVEHIGYGAFTNCASITYLYLNRTEYVGPYAFYGCSGLWTIGFSAPIMYIGAKAFMNCSSLKSLNFADATCIPTLENINAFTGTALSSIVVPNSLYSDWVMAPNWNLVSSLIKPVDQVASPVKFTSPTGNPIIDQYIDQYRFLSMTGETWMEGIAGGRYVCGFSSMTTFVSTAKMYIGNSAVANASVNFSSYSAFGRFFTGAGSFSGSLFNGNAPSLMVFYSSAVTFSNGIFMSQGSTSENNVTIVFPNLTSISRVFGTTQRMFSSTSTILSIFVPSGVYETIVNDAGLGANIYHCLYSF